VSGGGRSLPMQKGGISVIGLLVALKHGLAMISGGLSPISN
jgi:hypothetical protein